MTEPREILKQSHTDRDRETDIESVREFQKDRQRHRETKTDRVGETELQRQRKTETDRKAKRRKGEGGVERQTDRDREKHS